MEWSTELIKDLDRYKISGAHNLELWVWTAIQETAQDLGRIREREREKEVPRVGVAGEEQERSCSSSSLGVSRVGEMKISAKWKFRNS